MPGFSINPQLLVLSCVQRPSAGKTIRKYSYFLAKVEVYPQLVPWRLDWSSVKRHSVLLGFPAGFP